VAPDLRNTKSAKSLTDRGLSSLFKKEHTPTEQFVQLASVVNQEVSALVRLQMGEQNSSLFQRSRNLGTGFRLHWLA